MRIFVSGGAGYVGSHCVRRLVAAGEQVTVFDNLSSGHRQAVHPDAKFIQGDLADAPRLRQIITPGTFDAVMHFAAFLNVGESVQKPILYYRNNVANTLNLLEAMEAAGVRRMVFSSTCAVYGVPERLPITEDLPKNPISPYGSSKLTMEWLLRDSAIAWGLGSVCLRYFNASGAAADGSIGQDYSPPVHLIPIVLQAPLGQRENVKVFGTDYPTPDGSCIRDYIHVDDLAEAHFLAVQGIRAGVAEAFNVGTGHGHSVLEVLESARRITGHPIPAIPAERRPGDPPALFADPSAIRQRFGWSARYTDLDSVVRSAWQWHSRRPRGYAAEK